MPLFDRVRELPLVIDRVELEPHALALKHLTRRTTVIHLHGGGHEGVGEDVSYDEDLQLAFTDDALPSLAGRHTLEGFSGLVADQPGYRPWGLESAALDLALRQAGLSLAEAVGREPKPVRFVVSQSAIREWRELYPELRFKLDASDKWTDEVVAELAATGAVDVVDLKGLYDGEWVEATPSAELYGRVAEGLPGRLARGRAHHGRDAAGAGAAPRPAHLGLPDPLRRGHRRARVAAALPQLEAVALRLRPEALRLLRRLRGARDRALRGRPVRARSGPRPDPAPRLALPRGHAERRRAEGVQRRRPQARPAAEPAPAGVRRARVPVSYKRPITSRGALKRGERERAVGVDPEDEAARWLEEHDPKPPPPEPKAAKKSKAVHRFRQRQQRDALAVENAEQRVDVDELERLQLRAAASAERE